MDKSMDVSGGLKKVFIGAALGLAGCVFAHVVLAKFAIAPLLHGIEPFGFAEDLVAQFTGATAPTVEMASNPALADLNKALS
jgi:hypothetical protein